ncbi:MAG: hypothetical protein EOO66_30810, partial [Methylobacterium sp.]
MGQVRVAAAHHVGEAEEEDDGHCEAGDANLSQRLMRLRVLLQFVAILV